jgi:hypothetical protein
MPAGGRGWRRCRCGSIARDSTAAHLEACSDMDPGAVCCMVGWPCATAAGDLGVCQLAIDSGTTRTTAAYIDPSSGGAALVRPGRDDSDARPSLLHVHPDGVVLVGHDASIAHRGGRAHTHASVRCHRRCRSRYGCWLCCRRRTSGGFLLRCCHVSRLWSIGSACVGVARCRVSDVKRSARWLAAGRNGLCSQHLRA